MLGNPKVECGSVSEGINLEKMRKLVSPMKNCLECEFFPYCGGRCLRMHIEFPENHKRTYCEITKRSIEMFRERIAEYSYADLSKSVKVQLENLLKFTSLCEKVP